jgi:hypothetical protein
MRRSIKAAVAGATAATAMLVATPGSALAYTRSCTVQQNSSHCSTANVTASAGHQVVVATYNVQGRSYELRVRDVTNNRVVFSTATSGQVYRTLSNVYATYRAEIFCYNNCPGMMVALWN